MNILYCGDANTAQGLMMSVLSLMKYVDEPVHFFVFTVDLTYAEGRISGFPEHVIRVLGRRVREKNPDNSIECINITEQFVREMPVKNMKTSFTPCCMLRLYADLIPQIPDRVLYLDTDVICRGNIQSFYNMPMEGYEFAGALDYYGSWLFYNRELHRNYINSGVMLLNMNEIRKTGLFAKCRMLCREKKMFIPDQSALNKLAVSKKIVQNRFNEQRKLHSDTVLQHFTTSFRFFPVFRVIKVKPWQEEQMHRILKVYEYDDLLWEANACLENRS